MDSLGRNLSLCLVAILVLSSPLMVQPALGQVGVTTPAIPNYSTNLGTFTDYIEPTYGVDPQTGKAVLITEGYERSYKYVMVDIWGQPFVSYTNSDGEAIRLFYEVRWKGNNDTWWHNYPQYLEDVADPWDQAEGRHLQIGFIGVEYNNGFILPLIDTKLNQINIQVQALIGYYNTTGVFVGKASGWSDTQTITLSNPSNSPTPTPTVPEYSLVIVLFLLVIIPLITAFAKKNAILKRCITNQM